MALKKSLKQSCLKYRKIQKNYFSDPVKNLKKNLKMRIIFFRKMEKVYSMMKKVLQKLLINCKSLKKLISITFSNKF